ncbi:hypothetical protein Aduo_012485 [Ancylostoma duodenale]
MTPTIARDIRVFLITCFGSLREEDVERNKREEVSWSFAERRRRVTCTYNDAGPAALQTNATVQIEFQLSVEMGK